MDFNEHVLVQLGQDDLYLDVTGIHTRSALTRAWSLVHEMHPIAYDLGAHILPDPQAPENTRARKVAQALIGQYLPRASPI